MIETNLFRAHSSSLSRFASSGRSLLLVPALVVASGASAMANSQTWTTGGGTAAWSDTTNWGGNTAPGNTSAGATATTDTATFNTAVGTIGTSGNPITIDTGRTIGSISFGTSAGAFFIGSATTNTLSLSSGGSITNNSANIETINAPLSIAGANGAYTFNSNGTALAAVLNFGGNIMGGTAGNTVLTLAGTNTGTSTISGTITNGSATTMGVTVNGSTAWALSAANTYTGPTTVTSGTLLLNNAAAAGTGTIFLNGGTLGSGNSSTIGNTIYAVGGTSSTLLSPSGQSLSTSGAWQGAGTINIGTASSTMSVYITSTGTTPTSQFTGTINVNAGSFLQENQNVNTTVDLSGATINIVGGTMRWNLSTNNTRTVQYNLGALSGSTGTLSGITGGTANESTGYLIGFLNTSTTFGGNFVNGTSNGTYLQKIGTGTLVLGGAANTGSPTITMYGGTLQIGNGTNETYGAAPLTFADTSTFIAQADAAGSNLTLGALTFSAGAGTVESAYGTSGTGTLKFASLAARTAGATANFVISGGTPGATGNNNITFTTAPATGTLLSSGEFYNGSAYAAYDTGGFIRAYTTSDAGAVTSAAGSSTIANGANNNVFLTGADTTQSTATVNTINMGSAGTIAMASTGTLFTSGLLVSGDSAATVSGGTLTSATSGGELVAYVNNANDQLTISSNIAANGATAFTKSGSGTLVLSGFDNYTGATTIDQGVVSLTGTLSTLGANSVSTVSVNGGILAITGSLTASSTQIGNATGAQAAVYQSGGVVTGTILPSGAVVIGSAAGAAGYYNLSGGTINVPEEIDVAGPNGTDNTFGELDMSSGTINLANSTATYFLVNRGGAGETSVVNFSGGTVQIAGGGTPANTATAYEGIVANITNVGNQVSTITISGTAQVLTPSLTTKLNDTNFGGTGNSTNQSELNLNGGLLQTLGFGTAVNSSAAGSNFAVINFNGGTLKAGTAGNTAFLTNLGAVNVFSGGGTIDNNGQAITIGQSLLGASGTGVSSVTVSSGGAGYIAPPKIVFSGGTTVGGLLSNQATGYATISPTTGAVTGIVITNAGEYTSTTGLTVQIVGGGGGTTSAVLGTMTLNSGNTSGGLIFQGNGVTTLAGANTYTGSTAINAGQVSLTGTMTGTAIATSGTATLSEVTGGSLAGATSFAQGSSGTSTLAGLNSNTGATSASAGLISLTGTLNGSSVSTSSGGVITESSTGVIGGSAGVTQGSSGTMTLAGANTYTGATLVSGGKLLLSGSGSINNSSGITINGSGASFVQTSTVASTPSVLVTQGTLNGVGTVGAVTVGNGTGGIVANGNGGTGQLTVGSLNFLGTTANSGALSIDVAGGATLTTPGIIDSGALTTQALGNGEVTVNVTPTSAWALGTNTYDLLSFSSITGTTTDFSLGTIGSLTSRESATLGLSGGYLTLTIAADAPKWTGNDLNGLWQVGTTGSNHNWQLITAGTPTDYISGDTVLFDDTASSTAVLINAANVTPTTTTFNNSTKTYTISSSAGFGIAGTGNLVKNGTGTVSISTNNSYTGATTVNAGLLVLSGSNTTTGSTTITGGALNVQNSNALGTSAAVTVANGASLQLQGGITTGNVPLTITGTGTGGNGALESVSGSNTYAGLVTLGGNATIGSDTAGSLLTLSNTGTITGSGNNLTLTGAGNGAIASSIGTGAGGVTMSGTGTWTLSGSSAYTGNTSVSSGVLALTGTLNGTNIATSGTGALSESSAGVIAGGVNLTQGSSAVSTLSGANTFTGTTNVNTGTLLLGNTLALQSSTVNPNGGAISFGTLTSSTFGALTGSQNLVLSNTSSAAVALTTGGNNASTTYSGNLSGAGSLTKSGSGTMVLTGSNSYAGSTTVAGGLLQVNAGGSINGGAINTNEVAGAVVTLNGGTITSNAVSTIGFGSSLNIVSGTATFNGGLNTDGGNNNSDNGALISVTGGVLNASSMTLGRGSENIGAGTLAATYQGLYVNGGIANINGALSLGNFTNANSSATLRVDSGTLNVTGTTTVVGENSGRYSVVDVNGGVMNAATIQLGGTFANVTDELMLTSTGTVNATGVIFGTSTQTAGNNELYMAGGTLYLGSGGLAEGTSSTAPATIALGVTGTTTTLGASAAWSSSLAMGLTSGSTTFQAADVNGNAQNITLSGVISGNGGVIKTGAGVLALSGTNTYAGGTTINAGTLQVSGIQNLGAGATQTYAGVTFNGGTLQYTASDTGTATMDLTRGTGVTLAGTGTIDTNGNAVYFSKGVGNSGAGGLTLNDSNAHTGTLTLEGVNTYTGLTTIAAGTLILNDVFDPGTELSASSGVTLTGTNAAFDISAQSTVTINDLSGVAGSKVFLGGAGLTLGTSNSTTYAGVISDGGSSGGTGGSLTKQNSGTLTLTGANTYTGGTTITTGAVQLGNGGTTGALSSTGAISDNDTFIVDRSNAVTQGTDFSSSAISGSGNFINLGTGTTTFLAANSYTGTTTVSNGAVQLGNGGTTGALASGGTIVDNSKLIIDRSNAVVQGTDFSSSGISGTGALAQIGSGMTTLSAANTYTGGTSISGGQLRITGSTSSSGTVALGGFAGGTATAVLSGTGSIGGALVTSSANSNVAHIAPGSNTSGNFGSAGTLSVGGALTIGSGTDLDFDLATTTTIGSGVNDLIAMSGGTLTIGGTGIVVNFNELGASLATGTAYTLVSGAGSISGFSAADFSATGIGSDTAVFSISGGNLQVTFTALSSPVAYFNGLSSDMTSAANYYTTAGGNTVVSTAPSSSTDVYLTSNSSSTTGASVTTPTLNSNLSINSLTFTGAGTPATAGVNLTGTGTLTILAATTTGNGGTNTAPNGVTVQTGAGNDTVAVPVALGSSQSWTVTDATNTLTVSGQISDGGSGYSLTKTGSGVLALSGSNTYSGGTALNAGTLLLSNTNGSATGTGALTVGAGATIGGHGSSLGTSFSLSGTGTATGSRANVLVGMNSLNSINTTQVLTLKASGQSTIADANLTFNLDALSTGSTQLSVGATNVAFGTDSVASVKLTLNVQNEPAIIGNGTMYTLIAGTGVTSTSVGSSSGQYTGLTLGSTTTLLSGATETVITGNNLQIAFGSSLDQAYYGNGSYLVLYQSSGVDDIDVVVVPEPGTWALMLGGLAVLVFWQRRRQSKN